MFQKTSTARGLIHRIFSLSSEMFWIKNKKIATDLLLRNNYPKQLTTKLIDQFMQKRENPQHGNEIEDSQTIEKATPPKSYVGCKYINGYSEVLRKLNKHFNPTIDLAFRSSNNVRTICPQKKDKIEKMHKSGVIYSVQCNKCDKQYIGQTGQTLKTRMKQHENDYKNRNKRKKNKQTTGAVQHALETNHTFDFSNPAILDVESHLGRRLCIEMLHVAKVKDKSANLKTDTDGLSVTYKQVLDLPTSGRKITPPSSLYVNHQQMAK